MTKNQATKPQTVTIGSPVYWWADTCTEYQKAPEIVGAEVLAIEPNGDIVVEWEGERKTIKASWLADLADLDDEDEARERNVRGANGCSKCSGTLSHLFHSQG
jgi:hypothetical protein